MACSKSALGKNVIDQVDKLLTSQESRQQIINRYLQFMTDNGKVEFKTLFSKH